MLGTNDAEEACECCGELTAYLYGAEGLPVCERCKVIELREIKEITNKKIKLFTHTDLDGVGCAIIGKWWFADIDIEYCGYNNVCEKFEKFWFCEECKEYDLVFMTDLSIAGDEELVARVAGGDTSKFKMLDHHKTAEWLNMYYWAEVTVENEKGLCSGSSLFYEYLVKNDMAYDEEYLGEFVEIVRRYDTWEWKNVYKRDEPKLWNNLLDIVGRDGFMKNVEEKLWNDNITLSESDNMLLNIEQRKIKEYIERKNEKMQTYVLDIDGGELDVGVVFAENYVSELGNALCELNEELDLVAIVIMPGTVSLRTIKENVDVSVIAKSFGGGGHRKAAGYRLSADDILDFTHIII